MTFVDSVLERDQGTVETKKSSPISEGSETETRIRTIRCHSGIAGPQTRNWDEDCKFTMRSLQNSVLSSIFPNLPLVIAATRLAMPSPPPCAFPFKPGRIAHSYSCNIPNPIPPFTRPSRLSLQGPDSPNPNPHHRFAVKSGTRRESSSSKLTDILVTGGRSTTPRTDLSADRQGKLPLLALHLAWRP